MIDNCKIEHLKAESLENLLEMYIPFLLMNMEKIWLLLSFKPTKGNIAGAVYGCKTCQKKIEVILKIMLEGIYVQEKNLYIFCRGI